MFLLETEESLIVWVGKDASATEKTNALYYAQVSCVYLTIIPRARMGSESIAHEAEGRMGYGLGGHEVERNNCFNKIQLLGQKYREQKNFS